MMRVWWHICGRYYERRAEDALAKYLRLSKRAEKFFSRIKGEPQYGADE